MSTPIEAVPSLDVQFSNGETILTLSSARSIWYRLRGLIWRGMLGSLVVMMGLLFFRGFVNNDVAFLEILFEITYASTAGSLLLLFLHMLSSSLHPKSPIKLSSSHLHAVQCRIPLSAVQALTVEPTQRGFALKVTTPDNTVIIARHRERRPVAALLEHVARHESLIDAGDYSEAGGWQRRQSANKAPIRVPTSGMIQKRGTAGEQTFQLQASVHNQRITGTIMLFLFPALLLWLPSKIGIAFSALALVLLVPVLGYLLWLKYAPTQRIILRQRAVQYGQKTLPLESIHALEIQSGRLRKTLWAHTATGRHPLAHHPDEATLLTLQLPIEERARALRAASLNAGVAVDEAPAIPEALRSLRQTER